VYGYHTINCSPDSTSGWEIRTDCRRALAPSNKSHWVVCCSITLWQVKQRVRRPPRHLQVITQGTDPPQIVTMPGKRAWPLKCGPNQSWMFPGHLWCCTSNTEVKADLHRCGLANTAHNQCYFSSHLFLFYFFF